MTGGGRATGGAFVAATGAVCVEAAGVVGVSAWLLLGVAAFDDAAAGVVSNAGAVDGVAVVVVFGWEALLQWQQA